MRGLLLAIFLLQTAAPSGTLRGTVLTTDGKGLRDASIELTGPRGNSVVHTDDQGRFVLANLAEGASRVLVKKEGYVRQEYGRPILVTGRTPVDLVFRLGPAATIELKLSSVSRTFSRLKLPSPIAMTSN